MKNILIIILACCSNLYLSAQSAAVINYPNVGSPILDHEYSDLDNYTSDSFKLSDFRGTWLIVDFWSRFCGGCIASFPKMNEIHRQFKDDVQLIMVGLSPDDATRNLYNRMKAIYSLEFTVAFDAESETKYDIYSLPTIFIIDPNGILVAKTLSVSPEQIRELLNGGKPSFKTQFSQHERVPFNRALPMLTTGGMANGGVDTAFLFRSILAQYDGENNFPAAANIIAKGSTAIKAGRVEVARFSLEQLYKLAYFGKVYWGIGDPFYGKYSKQVILDIKDSTDFVIDFSTFKGFYVYSLIVPKQRASADFLKQCVQDDLKKYFGYEVTVEKRAMRAFHLIVVDRQKAGRLRTKGGEKHNHFVDTTYIGMGFSARNIPMKTLVRNLEIALIGDQNDYPLIDKTGIDYCIDMDINFQFHGELEKTNDYLRKTYGLNIIEAKEMMNTIVVGVKKIQIE